MSKVLISALGVGNNDGREYRTAKCFMKDKPDTIETPFGILSLWILIWGQPVKDIACCIL